MSIKKHGTIDYEMVETTPIVFKEKLYIVESVRKTYYENNHDGIAYLRVVDYSNGSVVSEFGLDHWFVSAYAEGDKVYCFALDRSENVKDFSIINVFITSDLTEWEKYTAVNKPKWTLYNTSVCKCEDHYIMALEVGSPKKVTGVRFTVYFAESKDLIKWEMLDEKHVYSKAMYTACPAIRYYDKYFYMVYLERHPCSESRYTVNLDGREDTVKYVAHIARSKDLIAWERSDKPFLHHSEEDKIIISDKIRNKFSDRVLEKEDINNSDIDFCNYNGKVFICYSWGCQRGDEFLALAEYEGSEREMLKSFFDCQEGKTRNH